MMESLIAGVLYAAIFSHYATEMQPLEFKKKSQFGCRVITAGLLASNCEHFCLNTGRFDE